MAGKKGDKGGRPKGEDKEQIFARLPVALADLIRREAKANKRTISAQVEIYIQQGLITEEQIS
jgi:hypothetical protein